MSKYNLISQKTGHQTLCDKVTIDGFNYYVSEELPKDNQGYWIYIGFNEPLKVVKSNQPLGWFEKLWDKHNYKTPVATNNPNIDIPQVVDEVFEFARQEYENLPKEFRFGLERWFSGFRHGYNKAKETHPFTEQDMLEFSWWLVANIGRFADDKAAHFEKEYLNQWLAAKSTKINLYYND